MAPDRTIKTSRKRRIVGPSKGTDAITKKQAEIARDQFLANLNAAPSPCQAAVQATEPADIGAILEDPYPLIAETCVDTGARISEATGLKIRNVDFESGIIRIEQRNWRGDIDEPKTAKSRRTLALGTLVDAIASGCKA